MERLCLDCEQPIKGRIDKKFCDDVCRTSFNNRLKTTDRILLKEINSILRKNRKILKEKYAEGKTKIKRDLLIRKGFDFDYHTHITTTNAHTYFYCYEFGYLVLEDGDVDLIM